MQACQVLLHEDPGKAEAEFCRLCFMLHRRADGLGKEVTRLADEVRSRDDVLRQQTVRLTSLAHEVAVLKAQNATLTSRVLELKERLVAADGADEQRAGGADDGADNKNGH
jgi:hypothetical protein